VAISCCRITGNCTAPNVAQIGHSKSAYSTISTGALSLPITYPGNVLSALVSGTVVSATHSTPCPPALEPNQIHTSPPARTAATSQ